MAEYSDQWEDMLVDIAGGKSLRKVCIQREIPFANLYRWIEKAPERAEQYARSMETRADCLGDEIDDLANEAIENPEKSNAYRVAIDAKKWIASKLKPKRYGDKLAVSGDADGPPLQVSVVEYK